MTVTRRDALKLAAAGAVVPLLPDAATAVPAAAAAKAGRFLSAAEMALLDELTEMIIPKDDHSGGARAAGVIHYIDGRLAEYDPGIAPLREEREKWRNGLKAVDALARAASGKSFLESTAAERTALLERMAEKPETIAEGFFVELKAWTVRGYYTSKVGIHDEMEYKGNTMLQDFAGTDPATLPRVVPPED